jgi:hypothetical protein
MEKKQKPKFTVRAVESVEAKSTQEVEKELLQKHEEKIKAEEIDAGMEQVAESTDSANPTPEQTEAKPETETPELKGELEDKDILKYIKDRYDKDISSVDDLFTQRESNEELPEDVSAFFKYKKETGRGLNDFAKLQKNYNDLDDDRVLTDYYSTTEEGLDEIDVQDLIDDKFGYDSELDDEKVVKKKRLAKKRELSKARKFFETQKEQYKLPLESSPAVSSKEQDEEFKRYKSYMEESKTQEEARKKRYDWFVQKTNEVFNQDFKGFDISVNDKAYTYRPGDTTELKNKQADYTSFVSPFLDEKTGMMKDAKGYHKAIAIASNPEKFARFFYEQGKAEAIDDVAKKSKNIDMVRKTPQNFSKNGLKIRAVGDTSSGRGLRIRSIKKS